MDAASLSLRQCTQMPYHPSRWAFPIVLGGILGVTLLQYLTGAHLLPYHSIYRTLYYLPITTAAVAFGQRGGLITALVVIVAYLPHIVGTGETLPEGVFDNLLELLLFLVIAGLLGYLSDRERLLRRRTEHLRAYIDAVLQSLPVGVATSRTNDIPLAHNPTANTLLPIMAPAGVLNTLVPGYHALNGGQRPLGVYVSPLYMDNNHNDERVYVIEDLTDRRALEAQLRRMDRLASVGQLAAGIAHEVRNPLAIVRATAQVLGRHLHDDPSVATYTQVLTDESDRIEGLVSQLLDYARPHPPMLAPCDLDIILRAVVHKISPYAMQHQVHVTVDVREDETFMGDEGQIKQMLLNLLLNAIQASPPDTTVHLCGTYASGAVSLTISDEGCGMPPHVQEHACDPFFTTRSDGIGLGLALVSTMIQEHGGSLAFTSDVGRGTVVRITLPQEAPHGKRANH